MAVILRQLADSNPLNSALIFGLAVLALVPALLFSSFVPAWAPPAAAAGAVLLLLLRGLAAGRLSGQASVDASLVVLALLLPLGLAITADPAVSLPRTYAFVANLALCWAVAAQAGTAWLERSGWLLLLAGLLLGVIFVLGTRFSLAKLPFIDRNIYRLLPGGLRPFWNPQGFNPNLSGGLLALFWPPAVALALWGRSWPERDAAKLVAVVLAGLLLLTQSRGALLGLVAAVVVMTVVLSRSWGLFWLAAGLLAGLGLYRLGPDLWLETVAGRGDALGNLSLSARQELWQATLQLIRLHPLAGVGLGMVEPMLKLHFPSALIRPTADIRHAHNLYLQVGGEMGLPGLAAHLVLFGVLFYRLLRRAAGRRAGGAWVLALGLLGSLTVFLTHGFFEVITYAPRAAIVVWALFGLMVAVTSDPAGRPGERGADGAPGWGPAADAGRPAGPGGADPRPVG